MTTKIYVVLGESGEYSSRSVWVSGAYLDRAKAEEAMLAAMARSRAHDQWAQRQEAERLAGPEPEYEPAERVSLHEGVIGEWGPDRGSFTEIVEME